MKSYNHIEEQQKMLKNATDEQLRIMRLKIEKELEARLERQELRYFKKRPIGSALQ